MTQKLPYFPFYIGDWRKDLGVKALNLELRGLWLEMLFDMWESEQRGKLLINGKNPSDEILAEFYGISLKKFKKMKEKLLFLGVASTDENLKCIYSRRMVRDEKIRVIRSEAGKKGGESTARKNDLLDVLLKQNVNQNPVSDNETETDTESLTKSETWKIIKQETFEKRWKSYPGKKDGKKASSGHWNSSIKKYEDIRKYDSALENYREDVRFERNNGFPGLNWKNGSTWFNNWQDYIGEEKEPEVSGKASEQPKPRIPGDPILEEFWNKALKKIKPQVEESNYSTWFKPTYPRSLSNGTLEISVPNQFVRKSLIENYRGLIESTLSDIRGSPILADFCIGRG